MKKALLLAAALGLVAGPAFAQYGGGGQNAGGPLGSYLRSQGYGSGGYGSGGYGYGGGAYGGGGPVGYGYSPAYDDASECYVQPRRFVDPWGRVVIRRVEVCE